MLWGRIVLLWVVLVAVVLMFFAGLPRDRF